MQTYTQTEQSGKTTLHISLMPGPFFFSLLTMDEIRNEKTRKNRQKTETKTPENVRIQSNFKEYHRRALLGTH